MTKPLVYVALDYADQQKNLALVRELSGTVNSSSFGFKVNLDSVANFSEGAMNPHDYVREIASFHKPVFVDMKMWNGGRTMANIAKGCRDLGVDMTNVYPHAGVEFMRKVAKELEGSNTKLFGLTVLTHYTDEDTQRLYGLSLAEAVRKFANMAIDGGCQGIILPGNQLDAVRDLPLLKLCPGIRPAWYKAKNDNDQEQVVTPSQATDAGANYIVVGSPILKSEDKPEALERILLEIK